jgi:L-cysteine:1D-myo-inositol 2-amino-2-deoxy-alpha-D-glucopyranoside ligase
VRLFDTARAEIVPFEPGEEVTIYVCGITPYDSTHLGHANTYVSYDLLIRRLEDLGHRVRLVRNITDVDDSILPKARELGVDFLELAAAETARFHGDMEALDTRPVENEPHATEWVDEMVELITRLEADGHVYSVDGTAYFDVTTFDSFGAVSGYDEATMIELARERGGHPDDPHQRHPLDFILWQPSLDDEPCWESPWGPGRPGWHIECSAMSMGIFGETIDLHGGGSDLIFPHHECERAQSEAATGTTFVRHWMHTGMVAYEGTKMSKSLGNLVFVSELSKVADPRAIRLALMAHHYRDDWEWFDTDIDSASALLDQLIAAAAMSTGPDPQPYADRLRAALDDDLDGPTAREILIELAEAVKTGGDDPTAPTVLTELGALCGVRLDRPAAPLS